MKTSYWSPAPCTSFEAGWLEAGELPTSAAVAAWLEAGALDAATGWRAIAKKGTMTTASSVPTTNFLGTAFGFTQYATICSSSPSGLTVISKGTALDGCTSPSLQSPQYGNKLRDCGLKSRRA